jgi:hypothetical protein
MSVWKTATANNGNTVYINLDRVGAVWREKELTVIRFGTDDKISIKETPEEFLPSADVLI